MVREIHSEARQIYDSLIAAYKAHVATGGVVQAYSLGGRSVTYKDQDKILKDMKYWAAIVKEEKDTANVAAGGESRRRMRTRLTRI